MARVVEEGRCRESNLDGFKGLLAGVRPREILGLALEALKKRVEVMSGPRDEPTIVIDHPEESLELFDRRGRSLIADRLDPIFHRVDSVGVDFVPKKVQRRLAKEALFRVDYQPVLLETFKEPFEVFIVFLRRGGCHQYIIDVYENVGNVRKDTVHESLKGLASRLQAKGSSRKLV